MPKDRGAGRSTLDIAVVVNHVVVMMVVIVSHRSNLPCCGVAMWG